MQYSKTHAVTIVAAAALAANRFIGYDGNYATSAGGVHDAQGISENATDAAGQAVSVITGYSGLVMAQEAIAVGDYVLPGTSGKAKTTGADADDHCGRALSAGGDGDLIEVQFVQRQAAAA